MNETSVPQPPRLGALEQQVMELLWTHGASTIRELIGRLPQEPAYTTISTVLRNLDRKQMVVPVRERNAVRYRPRRSRDEHAAVLMEHAWSTSEDRRTSILHFVGGMDPDDLALLRDHLERADLERDDRQASS